MMNILHCLHNYFPATGGAEWLMKNVSEKLVKRGHQVSVVATNAYSVEDYFLPGRGRAFLPKGQENINGVSVRRVGFSRRGAALFNFGRAVANRLPLPFGNRLRMISWGPRSRAYYREILRTPEIDLIVACPLPTLNVWYAWKASRKKKTPLVIIPCFHTEDRYTFHNPLYFQMLKEAEAVICLTEGEKNYLHSIGCIPRENLHSFGVGIEIDNSSPDLDIRQKYGIFQKESVLFLGQHGIHKGILDLIEAMKLVWEERPDTALLIAGNPTAHTAKIEEKIASLDENERKKVYLIQSFPESEKRAILKAADVFVSVSPYESFGIVFLEAWREKLPVIGCRAGGSSRLIEEYQDGFLVDQGRPRELAGAILELLEDSELRKKMGQMGYGKVIEKFSWDKIIDKWENLYHDLIHNRRSTLSQS